MPNPYVVSQFSTLIINCNDQSQIHANENSTHVPDTRIMDLKERCHFSSPNI